MQVMVSINLSYPEHFQNTHLVQISRVELALPTFLQVHFDVLTDVEQIHFDDVLTDQFGVPSWP